MAKIGSFKKVSSEIKGQITTLGFQAKAVRFVPEENASGNAPSHRVFFGEGEAGAAWRRFVETSSVHQWLVNRFLTSRRKGTW